MQQPSFGDFVLSTCNPTHVRSARMGMVDWTQVGPTLFVSPSTGYQHDCQPGTCKAWVMRFVDGVKICAISGQMHLHASSSSSSSSAAASSTLSPASTAMAVEQRTRKRLSHGEDALKRHQNKPLVGSTAYLTEKFNLDGKNGEDDDNDGMMDVETAKSTPLTLAFVGSRVNLY